MGNFFILNIDVKFIQHCLLKRLTFPHKRSLQPCRLSYIMFVFISSIERNIQLIAKLYSEVKEMENNVIVHNTLFCHILLQ